MRRDPFENVEFPSRRATYISNSMEEILPQSNLLSVPARNSPSTIPDKSTASYSPQTRRQILHGSPPITLLLTQGQLKRPPLRKKLMTDPIPTIRHPIQPRALDIYPPIAGIEIDIPYRGSLIRHRVGDTNRLKERRDDKVHVLPGVREEAHHREDGEGAHGARVVVAGEAGGGGVEGGGDVGVGAGGGEGGAGCVVVLEDG